MQGSVLFKKKDQNSLTSVKLNAEKSVENKYKA